MAKKLIKESKSKKVVKKAKVDIPDFCPKKFDQKICLKCKYHHYINKGFYPNNTMYFSCSLSQFVEEIPVK